MIDRRSRTRPKSGGPLAAALLCVLVLGAAGRAWAGSADAAGGEDTQGARGSDPCLTDAACRARYEEGRRAYKDKRYDVALKGYQAAYEQRQAPWLLINIGRSYQRLGRLRDALDAYERYQAADPNPDPNVMARVKEYAAQVRAGLGQPGTPPPAQPQTDPQLTGIGQVEPPPAPLSEKKPVYKKAWFWVAIAGAAVAVGAGVGLGVYFGTRSTEPLPQTKLPNPEPPTGVMVFEPKF